MRLLTGPTSPEASTNRSKATFRPSTTAQKKAWAKKVAQPVPRGPASQ